MFVQKCVVPAAVAVDALVVAALVVVVPIDILTVVDVAVAAAGAMLETLDDTVLAPSAVLTAGMTLVDPALEVTELGDVVVSKLRNAVVSSAPPPPPPPPSSSPVSGWGRDVCAPPFVLLV